MINESIFGQAHLTRLKHALSAYSVRHRVVADNLANVGTSDFKAQMVEFESKIGEVDSSRMRGRTSRPGHLPIGGTEEVGRQSISDVGESFDNGINDVNVDREMGELAKNDLAYRLATRLLGRKYQGLRTAITGRNP